MKPKAEMKEIFKAQQDEQNARIEEMAKGFSAKLELITQNVMEATMKEFHDSLRQPYIDPEVLNQDRNKRSQEQALRDLIQKDPHDRLFSRESKLIVEEMLNKSDFRNDLSSFFKTPRSDASQAAAASEATPANESAQAADSTPTNGMN